MAYPAAMELQTQIDELKAKVAQLEALLNDGNPRFGHITCDSWHVVDENGKLRIGAGTNADACYMEWWDKVVFRICVGVDSNGQPFAASYGNDGYPLIAAGIPVEARRRK